MISRLRLCQTPSTCAAGLQLDAAQIPCIRQNYVEEVADKLGRTRPDERVEIQRTLNAIDEEEARVPRLYAASMVTEENWRALWNEWQDKRQRLRGSLTLLDRRCETYISDLDAALAIIGQLGIVYETLPFDDR